MYEVRPIEVIIVAFLIFLFGCLVGSSIGKNPPEKEKVIISSERGFVIKLEPGKYEFH